MGSDDRTLVNRGPCVVAAETGDEGSLRSLSVEAMIIDGLRVRGKHLRLLHQTFIRILSVFHPEWDKCDRQSSVRSLSGSVDQTFSSCMTKDIGSTLKRPAAPTARIDIHELINQHHSLRRSSRDREIMV